LTIVSLGADFHAPIATPFEKSQRTKTFVASSNPDLSGGFLA